MDRLIAEARNSLGPFCYSECKAYCCRKGTLNMNQEQMHAVVRGEKQALLDNGRLTLKKGEFTLNLKGDCPSLLDNKCTIHTSSLRPLACEEFPLFVREVKGVKYVFATPRCPAVQAGKLYPYLKQLKKLGYHIAEPGEFSNLDVATLPEGKE